MDYIIYTKLCKLKKLSLVFNGKQSPFIIIATNISQKSPFLFILFVTATITYNLDKGPSQGLG